MRRARSTGIWLGAAGLAAVAFVVLQLKAGSVRDRPRDEDAIRAVLDSQVAAWNRGDLEGFMVGYWKNDEMTFCSGGTITKGWQPTLERYRKRYQVEGKEMGRLTFDVIRVEPIVDSIALVRGRWRLLLKDGKPEGLFTLQMKLFPEGWRVVYDHTSIAETPK
jgi:hypothetical protein